MKYYVALLASLCFGVESFSQSSIYQTAPQSALDRQVILLDQQLFSAVLFDNTSISTLSLLPDQAREVEFNQAISALALNRPDGVGRMKQFMQQHAAHPSGTRAAVLLGNHFFFSKMYAEAISTYSLANASLLPAEEGADLLFKMGYSHFVLKQVEPARRYLDQIKSLSYPIAADALYYSGCLAMDQGDENQAIEDLRLAERSSFYAPKVPYLLTALYYQQKQFSEAIAYAAPLVASGKNLEKQEVIHLYLAEAYYASQDFLHAAQQYEQVVLLSDRGRLSREELYKAGIAFFETKDYARATEYLKEVAGGKDDISQSASYFLGHSYVQLDNFSFASTSFQAAAASSLNLQIQEEALFNLAKTNLQRGSFQLAISSLDTYLDTYPTGKRASEAEGLLADALLNSTDYLRAMEQMNSLRSKSPRIQQAYQKVAYYQALIYYRDKKYEQALRYLTESQGYPSDKDLLSESHFWKGEIYAAQDQLDKAISSYQSALRLGSETNPYTVKAYYGLGYAYFNTQAYGKAEESFQSFLEKNTYKADPLLEDSQLRLADCFFVQKKFDQAVRAFTRAIETNNPEQDYALFRLAVVYNFQNRNQEAIQQLNRLTKEFPGSLYEEDALYQKGQIFLEDLRYEEAVTAFSALIQQKPNSPLLPFALESRAVAHFSLQQYTQSTADYKEILDRYPSASNSETALKGLQEALAVQENSEEFGTYLQAYKVANPEAGSVQFLEFESATNLYLSQKYAQAAKALENFLRSYPQSANRSEALYFAGDAYVKTGEVDKAFGFLKEVAAQSSSPQRIKALQQLGHIELDKGNFSEALVYYEAIGTSFRNKLEEAEVTQGKLRAYFALQNYQQALVAADQLLAMEGILPGSSPLALLYQGKSFLALNDLAQAEDSFGYLVQEYSTEEGAEGLLALAQIYQDKKEYAASNELIFDYSGAFSDFTYFYGSLFLVLAENYISLGETFQAKATLQSILDQSTVAQVKQKAELLLQTLL